jgi:hypothetical protein
MRINKKQSTIIIIGLGIILLMGLIPPWKCAFSVAKLSHLERPAGYGFIFYPPSPVNFAKSGEFGTTTMSNPSYWSVRLDFSRLFIQWAVIVIAVAGICLVLKENDEGSN